MAIRSDITFDWNSSPRKITVDAPSTEFAMQDVLDTLRYNEALLSNCDNQQIVNGNGKVVLDAEGNATGLTVQLINATVGFEARSGPLWDECYLSGGNLSGLEIDEETVTTQVTHNNAFININKTSSVSATISKGTIAENLDYGGVLYYDENSSYSGQSYPVGTAAEPVNNIVDWLALAIKYNLPIVVTLSDVNLDRDIEKFTIRGLVPDLTFYPHGFKADLCTFTEINIDGDFNYSNIVFEDCIIVSASDVYGKIKDCHLLQEIEVSVGEELIVISPESGGSSSLTKADIDSISKDTVIAIKEYEEEKEEEKEEEDRIKDLLITANRG